MKQKTPNPNPKPNPRLYNSNPGTADPDRLSPQQRINVGPTYAAQQVKSHQLYGRVTLDL